MEGIEILSMLFSAAFTVIGGAILYKFKQADSERREKDKELALERKHDLERSIRENKAMRDGLRAVLKTMLMQRAQYFEKENFASFQEVNDFQQMYEAYHNLGGNGFITKLLDEVEQLPHVKEVSG